MSRTILTLVVATALIVPLASASPASAAPPVKPLPTTGYADYQLGGAYAVPTGVTIVARDSTAKPAVGLYNICYINGFQTQPGESATWLALRKNLLVHVGGVPLVDANWPDEILLDTSTAAKRTAIAAAMKPVFTRCAAAGFQAVEIDNLDSYTRSSGKLTVAHNTAMALLYAKLAHGMGLAIGQKNSAELAVGLKKSVGFDFAVAEECWRWDECYSYKAAYGKRVIDIEYTDDMRGTLTQACANGNTPSRTIVRDRDLVPKGTRGYFYKRCP
jgi:hypothetical protein